MNLTLRKRPDTGEDMSLAAREIFSEDQRVFGDLIGCENS